MSYISAMKHRTWTWLGQYCWALPLFEVYRTLTSKNIGVVSKYTDIVIEGYPRSANTMAVAAFIMVQKEQVRLAHHVHGSAQILWAAKNNIPIIVLIRNPRDAVASLIVRGYGISIKEALRNYTRFYKSIEPIKSSCVIAQFDDVVKRFDQIIYRVNEKFDTNFTVFIPTKENMDRCFEAIEEMDKLDQRIDETGDRTVARPSMSREILTKNVKNNISAKEVSEYLDEAESIYKNILNS